MEFLVDARGEVCPKPVILTKKALDDGNNTSVTTIVDNEVAKDNVSKLASSQGYEYEVVTKSENEFHIHIVKSEAGECAVCTEMDIDLNKLTIAIGSDQMGSGDEKLGKILIKSFIYTVKETSPHPKTIALFNSGVKLACTDGQILDDLKELEGHGVEIIVCGTCLDFYELKESIKVGEIANMYSIYESMKNASNVINIG